MKKTKSKKASNNISANISFKEATFSQTANRLEIENKARKDWTVMANAAAVVYLNKQQEN